MRNLLTHRPARLVAALAAGAIALSACGGDASADGNDKMSPPGDEQGIDVGEPNPAAPDDSGDAGGTRPAGEDLAPEQRAEMLFGLTEQEAMNIALEFGWTARVGRIDGESYMLTEDYQLDRMTLELDSPAEGGDPVVTVVRIELEDGPATYQG